MEDFRACLCEMSLFTVPHCALRIALIVKRVKNKYFPGLYYFPPAVAFNTVSLLSMYQVPAFLGEKHYRELAKDAGLVLAVNSC